MACRHATTLDLRYLNGEDLSPAEDSDEAEILQHYGDAHEEAYLNKLKQSGRGLVEIDQSGHSLQKAAEETVAALKAGHEVVFQGALLQAPWGGWSDFLERVDRPSRLGDFSYEVVDTKLKRRPDPKHVLQLVLYSDLLAAVQGIEPECAHLELGNGERWTMRLVEYAAYARRVRDRLETFVQEPEPTRPDPVKACDLCRWRDHCDSHWDETDSLVLVAGISRNQRRKLEAAGISTLTELANSEGEVSKLASASLEKVRAQARLQSKRRAGGKPAFELRSVEPGRGFSLLPEPAPGDMFYDIEGDPYFEGGLEYLHGVWLEEDGQWVFRDFWAHDRHEEGEALRNLMTFFVDRLKKYPRAHIYHYAAYEVTALRRLTSTHRIGEAALDQLLREERFVDLYRVVSGGMYASEPAYSLKNLEVFYTDSRAGEVKTAGGSVVAYEKWRETRSADLLNEIRDYNEFDCRSTQLLRDWLVRDVRPAEVVWRRTGGPESESFNADAVLELDARDEALRQQLRPASEQYGEDFATLLFDLRHFHEREQKPAWWSIFDKVGREPEELIDELDCLGGLEANGPSEQEGKSHVRSYSFPEQETKLSEGAYNVATPNGPMVVTLKNLDLDACTAEIGFPVRHFDDAPETLSLLPASPLNTKPIEAAIERAFGSIVQNTGRYCAVEAFLQRQSPALASRERGQSLIDLDKDLVQETVAAISDLDHSVLPIQGPPGTGKTYISSCTILELIRRGKRVAVASNSHKAIDNLLFAVLDRANEAGESIDVTKKIGDEIHGPFGNLIYQTRKNDDPKLFNADLVGGTAWLLSRPDFDQHFDYLFVDEAGQVAVANIVAMGTSARNIVLVGDPMQLPQPIQGSHPGDSGKSALEYLLADHNTVPPDRGIFLPTSRRMHPDVCEFISQIVYEGRLGSDEGAARQSLEPIEGLPRSGAHLWPVPHEGNSQTSKEEIEVISEIMGLLMGKRFTDREGRDRALTIDDILIVAPYNAQVNALKRSLPDSARIGTVDKFQGQEAPVCLLSMTTSSANELPRDIEFLFSLNRINVAISRAQILSLVFASPRLLEVPCNTVGDMRLVNTVCALASESPLVS